LDNFLKRELKFGLFLFFFTLLLFGVHWYVDFYFVEEISYIIPLYFIYIFNFITVLIVYTLINYKYEKDQSQVFVYFMAATLVKMILAIVFLLPVLLGETEHAKTEVLNFFIPYFIYLGYEVVSISGLLSKK